MSHSDSTATIYNSASVVVATLTDEEGFPLSGNVDSLQASGIEYGVFSVNPQGGITNLTFNSAVPETSTWAMVLLGFAGLGFAGVSSFTQSLGIVHPRQKMDEPQL